MVSLANVIEYLYPLADLSPTGLVRIINDGGGDRISVWDASLGPQPTTEEIEAAKAGVARQIKRAEINRWRDAEEEKPLAWNGRSWQMRRSDREKIMGLALAGMAPPNGYWTDAHDNDVPMTAVDMQALYTAGITRIAQIHAHQRSRKAALDLLTDIAVIQAFDPAEGWAG